MTIGELEGRVVIVFGAGTSGTGISNGEAASLAYAKAGATVVAVDINSREAERVAEKINADGGRSLGIAANVTNESEVEAVVAATVGRFGAPHVLHNNVGVARTGSVMETDLESWNLSVAVNLNGAYLTCRHVLPHMLEAGRGVITNVSSVASIRDTGYVYPAYNASKAAVNQLTVSLALTYAGEGLRANALLPGLIETPLVTQQITNDPAALEARHRKSPTGRMGRPEDVANAAVFLASDRAAYINGVCLPVDGGLSARC